jgi:hypothetical protein
MGPAMSDRLRDPDDVRAAQVTENLLAPPSKSNDCRPLHLFLLHVDRTELFRAAGFGCRNSVRKNASAAMGTPKPIQEAKDQPSVA